MENLDSKLIPILVFLFVFSTFASLFIICKREFRRIGRQQRFIMFVINHAKKIGKNEGKECLQRRLKLLMRLDTRAFKGEKFVEIREILTKAILEQTFEEVEIMVYSKENQKRFLEEFFYIIYEEEGK